MTNLNIRVSISILVARLILIDLLAALIIGLFYFILFQGGEDLVNFSFTNSYLFLTVFIVLGIFKILTSIYVVLQWLNEYYEITHDSIVHKSGIIVRKVEQFRLDNVRSMKISSDLLGQIFNYGTITLFDIRMQKYLDMYLIHNPERYIKVFEQLKPNIEYKREDIRTHIIEKEEVR